MSRHCCALTSSRGLCQSTVPAASTLGALPFTGLASRGGSLPSPGTRSTTMMVMSSLRPRALRAALAYMAGMKLAAEKQCVPCTCFRRHA